MHTTNPYERTGPSLKNLDAFLRLKAPQGIPDNTEHDIEFRVRIAYDLDEGTARLQAAEKHSVIDATLTVCHVDMQVPPLKQEELFRMWLKEPRNVIELEEAVQRWADERME